MLVNLLTQTKLVIPDPILLWERYLLTTWLLGCYPRCRAVRDVGTLILFPSGLQPQAPGPPRASDWCSRIEAGRVGGRKEGHPSPGPGGAMLVLARRGAFPIIKIRIVAWTWARACHWPQQPDTTDQGQYVKEIFATKFKVVLKIHFNQFWEMF